MNDEPYVQWVAATRVSLALARDQAEVDAAESKESGSSSDDKGVGEEDGGQGVEMVETSTVAEIPFSDSEGEGLQILSMKRLVCWGEMLAAAEGETKRRGYSSRARRALGYLRRHGGRRRGTRAGAGSSKHRADLLDDLV